MNIYELFEDKAKKQRLDAKCWTGYHKAGTKVKGDTRVNNCVPNEGIEVVREFAPAGGGGSGDYFQALASAWYNGVFNTGSLPKGIKSQEDVERLLNRGIVCPDGKTRKLHIDYNSDFDGVEIYSDDYYNHGDESGELDSRTGQPWGPYDFMAFSDDQLDEATGDKKFDSMLSRMTAEPKYPDQDMPPTSIAELIQWADRNNKPYHEYFAQWARRNGFKNVNDALVWFGDNVDPSNPWGPKDFLDPFGRPAAEELEDAAKHDPKAAELMKVFRCYEEIVFDWPDEYRQMNMPVTRKGTDESLNEFAPPGGDDGGPDEDEILFRLAKQWWLGTESDMIRVERTLASMGWEIGEDEGSYDDGGVFVVRAGDVNGRSYQSWPHEELVAEGSLNEFAPDGFNGGNDDEGFSPEIAKMAQEDGFTKGAGLADGATLERAITINHWHSTHGGMYKQYFAKGFKAGRMDKIRHNNKQYNLNLKLMKDGSIRHGEQGVAEGSALMSVQQLATISDAALDKAYGYGRSTPGNTFGWQANLKSAAYAKKMIDKGVTDIEAISDAIHKGWNTTAQAFVQNPNQFDDTAKLQAAGKLEAKLQQRAQLMKQNYAQLPEEEKEKDRVVARALLQAIKGDLNEKSTSQAQFRTMAAAAHNPEFAKKVGIKQSVAREFHGADRKSSYKSLPKKVDEGIMDFVKPQQPKTAKDKLTLAAMRQIEKARADKERQDPTYVRSIDLPKNPDHVRVVTDGRGDYVPPKEADYGPEYQAMVKRVGQKAKQQELAKQKNKKEDSNMPVAVDSTSPIHGDIEEDIYESRLYKMKLAGYFD